MPVGYRTPAPERQRPRPAPVARRARAGDSGGRILGVMVARIPAALVVMLGLAAPPLVGIVCGLMCDAGHAGHVPVAGAHDGAAPGHAHGVAASAGPVLIGEHVCDHGLGVVDLYGPSIGSRAPLPSLAASPVSVPAPGAPALATAPWSQPLERVLGPPSRSPVLRV